MAMHTAWINHSLTQMGPASLDSCHDDTRPSVHSQDVPLHQNLFSLPFRPADRILCIWTPLDAPGEQIKASQQPCSPSFVLMPGSHRSSQLLTIDSEETVIYEPLPRASEKPRKEILVNPGDVLLYHPLLRHAAPMSWLGSFSTFFASSECQYIEYLDGNRDPLIPSHLKDIANMTVCPEVMKLVKSLDSISHSCLLAIFNEKSNDKLLAVMV